MKPVSLSTFLLAIALLALCLAESVAAQGWRSNPPPPLEEQGTLALSQTREGAITRNAVHTWTVDVEAGQYVELKLEQHGLWAFMRLRDPSGDVPFDTGYIHEDHNTGVVSLRWVADTSGTWNVDVGMARYSAEDGGRYGITWTASRPGVAADRLRIEADSLTSAAFYEPSALKAEPRLNRALAILEETLGPDHRDVAIRHVYLAGRYTNLGRHTEAESLLVRVLARHDGYFFKTSGEETLAELYEFQGRFEEAESVRLRLLALSEQMGDPENPTVSRRLNPLAWLYMYQGRYADAEPLLRRALAIQEETQVIYPNCSCINSLGMLYHFQGRYAEAEPLYRRALAIQEKAFPPDHREHGNVGGALANLAELYVDHERYAEAEPLIRRALGLAEQFYGPDSYPVAWSLGILGELYAGQGLHAEADSVYRRSLTIIETYGPDNPDVALILLNLARNRLETPEADPDDIRSLIDRAIDILDAIHGRPGEHIKAYALRARLAKQQGDLGGALGDLEEALLLAEDLRPQVSGGEEARASFFQGYAQYFDQMITWQLEDGNVEEAFQYAERGRTRVLLDQLAAGKIDLRASIQDDLLAPLEAKETHARSRLAAFQQRLTFTRSREDLSDEERLATITALEDSLHSADADYSDAYQQIKNASPLWRDVLTSGGQPVTLRNVQRKLLGSGELLLLYQVGQAASYVFVIGPSGAPEALPLMVPEAAASVLGLESGPLTEDALRTILGGGPGGGPGGEQDGAAGVIAQLSTRGTKVSGRAGFSSGERLHALWQTLVPEALWPRLVEAETAVLVPDAMLHFLPFEALVSEPGTGESGAGESGVRYWLDDGPVIRYAPSATVLWTITQRPASRVVPMAGAPLMLSLSDPIYNPVEVEAAQQGASKTTAAPAASTAPAATRDSYERAGGVFVRLPGTALETERIAEALQDPGAMVRLQGLEATEPQLRAAVSGKRYLHLATHGLVDASRRGLFASLVMTPPAGQTATIDDDGYLQLHEIYALALDETELAVLSACESNVGPEVEGEGVFALSRGFLAAGARRVVASQWSVDDASTAALVGSFFEAVLDDSPGSVRVDYGVALRDAKRAVRDQEQWSDPYYWAPFILAGKQ